MNKNNQIILIVVIVFLVIFSSGSYLYTLPNLKNLKPVNYVTVLIICSVGVGFYFLVDKIANDSINPAVCPEVNCTSDVPCGDACKQPYGFCDKRTGTCKCLQNWSGTNCDVPPECPIDGCLNKGNCVNGKCICTSDYTGLNCNILKTPKTCPDCKNGTCDPTTGICVCKDNWVGKNCDLEINKPCTEPKCNNNGQCNIIGQCICNDGYAGANCEIDNTNFLKKQNTGFLWAMLIAFGIISLIAVSALIYAAYVQRVNVGAIILTILYLPIGLVWGFIQEIIRFFTARRAGLGGGASA
jgi:hypothetical protein